MFVLCAESHAPGRRHRAIRRLTHRHSLASINGENKIQHNAIELPTVTTGCFKAGAEAEVGTVLFCTALFCMVFGGCNDAEAVVPSGFLAILSTS